MRGLLTPGSSPRWHLDADEERPQTLPDPCLSGFEHRKGKQVRRQKTQTLVTAKTRTGDRWSRSSFAFETGPRPASRAQQ